jgi:hypothetical protein
MDQQQHYVGLDVSLETTSVCVIDDKATVVWHGKCASTPESITAATRTHATAAVRVGLETGQLSNWLTLNLRRRGVPVVCLDARHAKAALSLQINKTDANDALGLAQIVRTGCRARRGRSQYRNRPGYTLEDGSGCLTIGVHFKRLLSALSKNEAFKETTNASNFWYAAIRFSRTIL